MGSRPPHQIQARRKSQIDTISRRLVSLKRKNYHRLRCFACYSWHMTCAAHPPSTLSHFTRKKKEKRKESMHVKFLCNYMSAMIKCIQKRRHRILVNIWSAVNFLNTNEKTQGWSNNGGNIVEYLDRHCLFSSRCYKLWLSETSSLRFK